METYIRRGVGLTIIILAVNALVSYEATRTLINNDQWVRHTYQVITELEVIFSTVKDAESAERGFIITGSPEYLEPYDSALAQINGQIDLLKQLTVDNPGQQTRVPTLQAAVDARMAALKNGVELRRNGQIRNATDVIASGAGKQRMDDLRTLINSMEADENQLLESRTAESRDSQRRTIATFGLANVIACAILLVTATIILKAIRQRKSGEDRLRQQRHLLEVTVSSIADAVIACDTHGSVLFLNRVAASLTGWTERDATGQPLTKVFNIVTEEGNKAVESPALRALREGTIVSLANHTILLAKDGRRIPIDDGASPIRTADGVVLGAVLIFRDITSRRKNDEERARLLAETEAARATAESASRAKDEFLAVLSHELRTPLTSVFGWVQLLQGRGIDDETRTKALEVIDRNVRAQTQLIDDLLNISQIITGKLQIRREMTDPLQIVKAAIETARPSADAKDIQVLLEPDDNLPMIYVDPARLQQIVWNLLSNAVKFTPKGGDIRVQVRRADSDLRIVVKDTGQGIPSAFLPLVFNRFSQADASSTRTHGGLGLGLALVKQLVELHGGTVSARSEGTGQGSTFTVSIPITALAIKEGEGSTPATENQTLSGLRILVVEDEPDTREMIAEALQRFGAAVTQAASASEALRLFVSEIEPNILISDIGMPDMDGYELLAAIQAQAKRVPPAIALTAFATSADKQRALHSGFQAHLTKPVELSTLVSTIADLANRRAS